MLFQGPCHASVTSESYRRIKCLQRSDDREGLGSPRRGSAHQCFLSVDVHISLNAWLCRGIWDSAVPTSPPTSGSSSVTWLHDLSMAFRTWPPNTINTHVQGERIYHTALAASFSHEVFIFPPITLWRWILSNCQLSVHTPRWSCWSWSDGYLPNYPVTEQYFPGKYWICLS